MSSPKRPTPLVGALPILLLIWPLLLVPAPDVPTSSPVRRVPPCGTADVVLGQPDFTSWGANRVEGCSIPSCAGPAGANTISLDDGRFAFDHGGRLWLSDKENNRVLRFDPPFENGQAAALVLGQADLDSNQHNRGLPVASAATLGGPMGLAFDAGPDRRHRSDDDRLWVADLKNSRVLRFDPPFSSGMDASVVLGQPDFLSQQNNRSGIVGRVNPVRNGFSYPRDLAFDRAGGLWISELENDRVVRYAAPIDESGPVPGANDEADAIIGQPTFTVRGPNRGNGTLVAADGFSDPRAIAIDRWGNLWVVDNDNQRVLRFDAPLDLSGEIPGASESADLVLGQDDFSTARPNRGATPSSSSFDTPAGIAIDLRGIVWVVDAGNARILGFQPPLGRGAVRGSADQADVVLGQPDMTSRGPNRGATQPGPDGLSYPNGLAVDRHGNVWTVEHDNDRALRFPCGWRPPFRRR